jgi:protoporphyrinogen oxidase
VDADLVVLGAGPAGLAAAYRAQRAGASVVVLERGPGPGGLARSISVAGQRVDLGSHRLHPSIDPEILVELRTLLGDDLQLRPRRGRILLEGRWVAFPLRATDLARNLPPSFAAGLTRDALAGRARRRRNGSFAAEVEAAFGPTLAHRFYLPYARKLWGLEPDELDAEQARRRISATGLGVLARRVLRGSSKRTFYYPRRGFGQLWEELADAAARAGAELRYSTAAEELRAGRDAVVVRTNAGEVRARVAFSTVPITALAGLVRPEPPETVTAAAAQLSFRAMVLVYLVVARPRYTSFDAHYLPGPATPLSRLSEPKNYRAGDDPADRTVLCAELPTEPGSELWCASDAELARSVAADLVAVGLPDPSPVASHVERLPRVYPVYRKGFARAFGEVDRWASGLARVLTFGRNGLFAHDNSHHALEMGWAAAAVLGPDGIDRARWAEARARFAAHVVED